ncbi:hypothetical protein DFQ30_010458 [Apophysomyces sp. BC1015]|nr:hypothetical protein DFQ30_010458 [Apophysomyces sp. BC1015]
MSRRYGQGLSAVNWGAPELLLSEETASLIKVTVPTLAKPESPETRDPLKYKRTFCISTAETMLILAALIYERDGYQVRSAFRESFRTTDRSLEADREMLIASEKTIRDVASRWDLSFEGITELNSMGGPFCGIYYSEKEPVIVVAFKGTTPTNYEEFLVDATLQRVDATPYLFGAVHQGFYESLFANSGLCENQVNSPYHRILATVNGKAKYIQEKLGINTPVQVWVTGHSLGAALSSLLFSRWLKCPEDLVGCELRDCYAFGSPAVGDSDFASHFASHNLLPLTRSSTMWRIINNYDAVCRIPIGQNSRTVGPYIRKMDLINYFHTGHAIKLIRRDEKLAEDEIPLEEYPSVYHPALVVKLIPGKYDRCIDLSNFKPLQTPYDESAKPWWTKPVEYLAASFGGGNPIHGIEKLCPFFIKDHLPIGYFNGLENVRRCCVEDVESLLQI